MLGYGRMGKEIEAVAADSDHQIVAIFEVDDSASPDKLQPDVDVLIDFSVPHAVMDNIKVAADTGIPIVIGTTGWTDALEAAKNMITGAKGAAIYAANFSPGVNLFFRISEYAAGLMNRFSEYDVFVHEMHHRGKVDSPSGTALHLAEGLLAAIKRKKTIQTNRSDGRIAESALHISSTRAGQVPGTHIVGYESAFDSIELKHTARNRRGFAVGAILAAQWLVGKTGFYTIDDLIDDFILGSATVAGNDLQN